VQTYRVSRGKGGEESKSLEVIDVASELGTRTRTSRSGWTRSRSGWAVLAVVIVGVAALGLALAVASRGGGGRATLPHVDTSTSHVPATASTAPSTSEEILGDFYPDLDQTDTTTLVLPSGLTVTLSGGLTKTIGGLGATFGGEVSRKGSQVCCPVSFSLYHASPSDLFETLGPDAISTPVSVSPAQATLGDLKQYAGRFGLLSTGDWTLIASSDVRDAVDAAVPKRLDGWRLRSTRHGALLELPADRTIDESHVLFLVNPSVPDRVVELTEHVEPCFSTPDTARTINTENGAAGHWCARGLFVAVNGPLSYVESVVANLKVIVKPNA
jgi:hypothetical protein